MEINKDIADLEAAEVRRNKRKKYVLCYHNLTVKNCKRASAQIRRLAEAVGGPISIAVVPSIGGVPESEAEFFRDEVEKFIAEGYEILIHGARHRADLFVKRDPLGKIALTLSHNSAEFAGLSKKLSQALLDRSLALWNSHGLGKASGFVPPTWIANKFLKRQALEQFENYEDLFNIYRKREKGVKTIGSPLFTFSILPLFLMGLYMAIACIAFALPFGTPRLVIHTKDYRVIGEKRLLGMVRFAAAMRERVMYRDL
ncbi:MAG: DUF2334 domain-containing protein [Fibrobacteraceae bacterium]|nr:DUF2334 domain-containing protein [Fibrobacteraceae bacterium]